MGDLTLAPPADGTRPTITAFGRTYTCAAGQTIAVPDFDALVLLANGWSLVAGASGGPFLFARSIVSANLDGQGYLILTYSDGTADRLGPLTMVSLGSATDPGATITVDPMTGDVFQTTEGQ